MSFLTRGKWAKPALWLHIKQPEEARRNRLVAERHRLLSQIAVLERQIDALAAAAARRQ